MYSQSSDGTNLRAEVPPFVPRKEWQENGGMPPSSSSPLPRYVTTCYPFVQEQQDGRWQGHSVMPPNYQMTGNSLPIPLQNNTMHPAMLAPAITGPSYLQGNIADSMQTNAVHSDSRGGSYHLHSHQRTYTQKNKRGDKQGYKKVGKRSVGVQKEVGRRDSDQPCETIMVDNCQQTDFPLSIACKSLIERPSPLKKNSRYRRRRANIANEGNGDSSSDHGDADIDSDSGYYSPNRRLANKKCGGTSTTELMHEERFHSRQSNHGISSMQHLVYMPHNNVAPPAYFYQVHPPPLLLQNTISPHVTPPPHGSQILSYATSDASVIMNQPGASVMNHSNSIAIRPPPGFPMPPSMVKSPSPMQPVNNVLWNTGQPYFTPGHNQHFNPGQQQRVSKSSDMRNRSNTPPNRKKQNQMCINTAIVNAYSPGREPNSDRRKYDRRDHRSKEDRGARGNLHNLTQQSEKNFNVLEAPPRTFFLEDIQEFPGLGSSLSVQTPTAGEKLSYSQALLQQHAPRPQVMMSQVDARGNSSKSHAGSEEFSKVEKAQKSRKQWKKAERASKAADEEYAEISKEQENIQKVLKKSSKKRRDENQVLDLGEIFSKLEGKAGKSTSSALNPSARNVVQVGGGTFGLRDNEQSKSGAQSKKIKASAPVNALDSTAPLVKRGKERETPKPKKPSALKKVILKEREEKKEHRLQQLTTVSNPDHDIPPYPSSILNPVPVGGAESAEEEVDVKMPPQLSVDNIPPNIPQIHSRRYREYCSQVLDKQIDETCTVILQKLVQFQDRLYQKDPVKAKMRRRLVMGLREVTKHLKLKRLKCVIISPNLEKIQSKGGLDDALQQILSLCQEQNVTYIFALGRKAMGRAVSKLVPVSIIGIFDYSGAEDQYKRLVELVADAQNKYKEMVTLFQQEVIAANTQPASVPTGLPGPSKRFAHMTHSRNPSAASCVSFASFISEPISEMNEGSNWRVLMDAGEDFNLSPPPEVDASSDEDPSPLRGQPHVHEQTSRKDSGSTVVECKPVLEEPEIEEKLEKLVISGRNSHENLSEGEEHKDDVSEKLSGNFFSTTSPPTTSADLTPEATQALRLSDANLAVGSDRKENSVASIEDAASSAAVQDRIQLWLQETCNSAADSDQNTDQDENISDCISSQEVLNKEDNSLEELTSVNRMNDS